MHPIAGEDPDQLGTALLEQGMDLSGTPLEVILARDTKEYITFWKKSRYFSGDGTVICLEPGAGGGNPCRSCTDESSLGFGYGAGALYQCTGKVK